MPLLVPSLITSQNVNQTVETDIALPITRAGAAKFVNVGLATETDTAQSILGVVESHQFINVGQAIEIDIAFNLVTYVPSWPSIVEDFPGVADVREMKTDYIYRFHDLLTNTLLAEWDLYGVYFKTELSGTGSFTGTIFLHDTDIRGVINSTSPGNSVVYVYRNGTVVWGGIIWSNTYSEQSLTMQLYAEQFESYMKNKRPRTDVTYTNKDPRNIMRAIWDPADPKSLQGDVPRSNIGILIPPAFADTNPFTKEISSKDRKYWLDYVTDLAHLEDIGFEYYIQTTDNGSGPVKRLLVDNNLGRLNPEESGLTFDFPGDISNFYWPENGRDGANGIALAGSGELFAEKLSSDYASAAIIRAYPAMDKWVSGYEHVDNQSQLDSIGGTVLDSFRIPITNPTIYLNPEKESHYDFGTWVPGDMARFNYEGSNRFPDGKVADQRLIGWEVRPPDTESHEEIALILHEEGG